MPLMSALITLLIFTIIVVAHEYGHFIVARKCGILVEEFAIGMGPKIVGWQRGETLFSIRAIPLGGFCKMLDGEPGSTADPRAFNSKKVWQRIAVCVAGAVMNFVLAVVLGAVFISATTVGTTIVDRVIPGSPAEIAGVMPGDRILSMGGSPTRSFEHISRALNRSGGNEIDIVVRRDGSRVTMPLTAAYTTFESGQTGYFMGIFSDRRAGFLNPMRQYYPAASVVDTLNGAWWVSVDSVVAVFDSLTMLFTGQANVSDMYGFIGVGHVINEGLQATVTQPEPIANPVAAMVTFGLRIAILLSASLGILNLLPIPALDGGRIVFLLIEGIRRKPLSAEKEGWIHLAGFVLVIGLAIIVAFNDIVRIIR